MGKRPAADIFELLRRTLHTACGVPHEIAEKISFSEPPQPSLGDISIACFPVSAVWKCAPPEAASRIATDLARALPAYISAARATGPYVNITLQTAPVIAYIKKSSRVRTQKKPHILFEYSQPNTHKEFHIGHLRNACYGTALLKIWRAAGRNVTAITYNNDVGSHVAKCLWALKKFHADEKPPEERGRWLASIYVEATRALEEHPEYKEEVSEVLHKLESCDRTWHALWKKTRSWSLAEFRAIYRELGMKFDATFNESDVKDRGHKIVDELLERGIAHKSQGAIIMGFEAQKKGVLILRKSDGAGNYTTSDLALAEKKHKKFRADESIILTDVRQSLYFEQLFMTLRTWGFTEKFSHIGYELVTLPEGAMSSRKGNVILYETLRDDVVEAATAETKKRHPDWSTRKIKTTAHVLALAAIKFTMVRSAPSNIIVFDKHEMLSFDGFTAPYILYTLARVNSIFKKAHFTVRRVTKNFVWSAVEHQLWFQVCRFDQIVAHAAAHNNPAEIAQYCFDLAKSFARYYEHTRVLDEHTATRAARLTLLHHISCTLERGLRLLNIPLISQM